MLLHSHVHTTRSTLIRSIFRHRASALLTSWRSNTLSDSHGSIEYICKALVACRAYSSSSEQFDGNIAVLGGGITGLATAYYLADALPRVKITLFERKDELGGWVRSKKVDVGNGEVLFEQGPRSLRPAVPNGTLALRMIQDLNLADDILITPKSSPAARNRFIYYPDHLVRMPGPRLPGDSFLANIWNNFSTIWREPIFAGVLSSIGKENGVPRRSADAKDESVRGFIARRWDERIADNLVSGLFHGIYAGDIRRLSAKSILPGPWRAEEKYESLTNSLFDAVFQKKSWVHCDDITLQMQLQDVEWAPNIKEGMRDCSVFTLRNGLGQLTNALVEQLESCENVEIKRSTIVHDITKVESSSSNNLQIRYGDPKDGVGGRSRLLGSTMEITHAISTVPPDALVPIAAGRRKDGGGPRRDKLYRPLKYSTSSAVTVMVINFYFRTPHLLQTLTPPGGVPMNPFAGFGYLIPASIPFAQNPERALGVIFDSDITPDLWSTLPDGEPQGTKLTVMMGGHWWDGWEQYPSAEEAKVMAKTVLARHLGITEEPVICEANLQKDCIPQYHVGHSEMHAEGHKVLKEIFGDRLRVAGSWYHGVGINDCLRSAWDCAVGLTADLQHTPSFGKDSPNENGAVVRKAASAKPMRYFKGSRTGLEHFTFPKGKPMVCTKRNSGGVVEVVEVEPEGLQMGYFEGVKMWKQKEKEKEDDD